MIYLKAYVVKLEINDIDIWGSEASDISKNQIKWKPDIYFLKIKLDIIFFASLCSEIGNKLHGYMGVWGLLPPEASDIS